MKISSVVSLLLGLLIVWCIVTIEKAFGMTTICSDSSIANNSMISLDSEMSNSISRCSMNYVTFRNQIAAILNIRDSTVAPGGIMRFVFGTFAFPLVLTSNIFGVDARLIFDGAIPPFSTITISGGSFDIRTPRGGDMVAIDFRPLVVFRRSTTVLLTKVAINIVAGPEVQGLVAGVAIVLNEYELFLFSILSCEINLNTTSVVAYGVYARSQTGQEASLTITGNYVSHPANQAGGANCTAFLLLFPMTSVNNQTSLVLLSLGQNTIDRIETSFRATGICSLVRVSRNTHSYYGPGTFSLDMIFENEGGGFEITQNYLSTFYEPWNAESSIGNPVLSITVKNIPGMSQVSHNEIHATRFLTSPLVFPGTNNFPFNTSLTMFGNYFTADQQGDSFLPMSSFALGPFASPRSVDLGMVFVCSNVWPATFVVASTTMSTAQRTTTVTSATPTSAPTRVPIVNPIGIALSVLVAPYDRPMHVNITEEGCPVFTTTQAPTRRPNTTNRHLSSHMLALIGAILISVLI